MKMFGKKESADKPEKDSVKSLFTSRTFRVGIYSTFASVIVIAIAVGIIMLVNTVPSQYTKIDCTSKKLYSISDQTKQLVSTLDQEVDVYLLAQSGKEDATLTELLGRYEGLSDKIKVINKDPVVYPNFAKQYTSETVADNSIIVVSGDRSQYISNDDIYVADYSNYNYYDQSSVTTNFDGESRITSAIDYVTSKNLPKLYVLSGHGEKDLSSSVTDMISRQNIDKETLNLLTEESVPEDCSCLAIIGPTSDISSGEKDQILTYLEGGGNLLLITDYSDADMPNLKAVTDYYGVKTADGIVFEGDSSYSLRGYNYYLLPSIGDHTITSPLKDKYYILMPYAQGIVKTDSARDTVTVTELLTTSDSSYAKNDPNNITSTDKEAGDTDGPFALGVAITETVDKGTTHIVWYTTTNLLEDKVDQYVSGANLNLVANTLNWMCGKESSISILSKSMAPEYLTVPSSSSSLWSLVMIGILPFGFLFAGLFVWVRRKRR